MCLGFHVVGDEVDGVVCGHLASRPECVVGKVGRQQGDTQLTLIRKRWAINRMRKYMDLYATLKLNYSHGITHGFPEQELVLPLKVQLSSSNKARSDKSHSS